VGLRPSAIERRSCTRPSSHQKIPASSSRRVGLIAAGGKALIPIDPTFEDWILNFNGERITKAIS
jgi:hypothetical protein